MGDTRWTDKSSRYITNLKVNSAFHLSGVGKSSCLPAYLAARAGRVHECRVATSSTVWSHTASDAP